MCEVSKEGHLLLLKVILKEITSYLFYFFFDKQPLASHKTFDLFFSGPANIDKVSHVQG